MKLLWDIRKFDDLDANVLYQIMQLRQKVFVVEQECAYLDADDLDQQATHMLGRNENGDLVAYCRLLKPTSYYKETSIGRVITVQEARGTGVGKDMMYLAIQACESLFPSDNIRIMAQYYLLKFYTDLGFQAEGEIFLEDGIEHIEMVYQVQS